MNHTPEPWTVEFDQYGGYDCMYAGWHLKDPDGKTIDTIESSEVNAERIVACVNGCAGLNPAAYREVVEALRNAQNTLDLWHTLYGDDVVPDVRPTCQRALTHAQGGQP